MGGEQFEAALEVLNLGGRSIICGAVATGHVPRNFCTVSHKELTLRGFTVTEHEGIEQVPAALESVLAGTSTGRVLVSIPALPTTETEP